MTRPPDGAAAPSGGRWLYPLLLAAQTLGILIIFWKGVPLYQQLVGDPAVYGRHADPLIWGLSAIALIQVGYWTRYRLRPALPEMHSAFLAHVVKFVARMSFMLATAIFGFVFLTQRLASQMPASRYAFTVVVLFSMFCYMLELLRLGNAMEDPAKASES